MGGGGDPALRSSIKIAISTKRNLDTPLPDSSDETLLLRSIACRDEGAALLLLEHGASAEYRTARGDYPLRAACAAGLSRVVKRLLHQGVPSLPPEQDSLHQFPFVVACRNAHLDVCEQLLHAQQHERRGVSGRHRSRSRPHRQSRDRAGSGEGGATGATGDGASSEHSTPTRTAGSDTSPTLSPGSTTATTPSFNTVTTCSTPVGTPSFGERSNTEGSEGSGRREGSSIHSSIHSSIGERSARERESRDSTHLRHLRPSSASRAAAAASRAAPCLYARASNARLLLHTASHTSPRTAVLIWQAESTRAARTACSPATSASGRSRPASSRGTSTSASSTTRRGRSTRPCRSS